MLTPATATPSAPNEHISDVHWPTRLLHQSLILVRPSPVAALLKRVFRIRRRLVQVDGGIFDVDPVSHIGSQLLYQRAYEPDLADAIRATLSPGATFVDVGANEGYFSVMAARIVGPRGRVIAVEPQVRLRAIIDRNVALNGVSNVTVVDAAVSDTEGSALLYLTPDTITGSSGLAQMVKYRVPTVPVRTTTLARVLDEAGVDRVDLLKMDIEGFEYEALLGSPELVRSRRLRAIALELHRSRLEARGRDPEEIIRLIEGSGYVRDMTVASTYYLWHAEA